MCNFFSIDYDIITQLYFLFKCRNFVNERNNWIKKNKNLNL